MRKVLSDLRDIFFLRIIVFSLNATLNESDFSILQSCFSMTFLMIFNNLWYQEFEWKLIVRHLKLMIFNTLGFAQHLVICATFSVFKVLFHYFDIFSKNSLFWNKVSKFHYSVIFTKIIENIRKKIIIQYYKFKNYWKLETCRYFCSWAFHSPTKIM